MIGKRYRHFKGGIYIVTDIAVHSETEKLMVVYKSFNEPTLTWVRPLDMFVSEVDKEKYPDVKQEMRFEEMSNQQRRMSMTDLDKAIKTLKEQYEKAKKIGWVQNPIAYALYQTWKIFDKQGE